LPAFVLLAVQAKPGSNFLFFNLLIWLPLWLLIMNKRIQAGTFLYPVLWGGAALIIAGMFIIGHRQQTYDKNNLHTLQPASSGEMINALMVSTNDLTIEEKKSFINLFLRKGEDPEETTSTAAIKKENVYRQILQRKINRPVKNQRPDDFSVKPVPK
jgi:hypothetical protein